ncbi:unnamed protein product [Cuscuta europaea]|uniref:CTLH domain-containing protein n=1 Tax=Cuscuta europaea TaxID=41803 RepID=A0A9P0ZHR2_CUSEU|nr:unnamed protein product [Cuscuta europaea]
MMDLDPRQYENIDASERDVHNMIVSYLVHNCFKDTVESFVDSTGMKQHASYCIEDMETRKRICDFTTKGNVLKAIEQTEKLAPDILEMNKDLHFDLLSLHFVELVASRKCIEALEFAQTNMAPFGKIHTYVEKLEDFIALLAYEEPDKSPMFHLLGLEYRQHVADSLNRAILSHEKRPSYSAVERLIQQITVVRQSLNQDPAGKEGSSVFSFKDFIMGR